MKTIIKELILVLSVEAYTFYSVLLCCEINDDFSRLWQMFSYTQIGVVLLSTFGLIFILFFKENKDGKN